MARHAYDLVVVGGGSAGQVAALTARALGARVALVDRERLGGECLWTGCVPSKSLIATARAAHITRNLAALGLGGTLEQVDLGAVMDRVQDVIGTINQTEDAEAMRRRGIDVYLGGGAFRSAQELEVGAAVLRGQAFLICTGSRPAVPHVPGLETVSYLTNETIFGLRALPAHLIVVGGGPVGVELAQCFRRLGAEVTVLAGQRGLLARDDHAAAALLARVFAREGITVRRGRLTRVAPDGPLIRATYTGPDESGEACGDQLLLAVGRVPNVAGLGLEQAGVAHDQERGIYIDTYLRTNVPHIFACGDVSGPYQFTHAAGFQAATAVRNALFPWARGKATLEPFPWVTFSNPEVAHVGMTERQARREGRRVVVLRHDFTEVDRAQAERATEGFVKLLVTPWQGTILGADIVGQNAGELIGEVTLAMRRKQSVTALAGTIHVYPTLAMGLQQAALRFYAQGRPYRLARGPLRALVRWHSGP